MLALVTFRPEFEPPWAGQAHVTTLSLSRLGRRQGGAMVGRVTGGKALPAEVLEQIVAAHRRRAAVRRGADQDGARVGPARGRRRPLRAGRPAAAAGDPGDPARLADGPPRPPGAGQGGGADRRLHRPRVRPRAARRGGAAGREPSCGRALDQLVAAELVFRRGEPPEATYTFKHALVQDAAYQSLLKEPAPAAARPDRRGARGAVPRGGETEPELLAQHLHRGGPGRAGDRLLAAGRRAGRWRARRTWRRSPS